MEIKDFFAQKRLQVGKRVECLPQVATKYVMNASQSYGVNFDPDKILFILDDTLLGSGRDGCVIAVTGIAFKAMFQQPWYIPFDKIEKIQVIGRAVVVNQNDYAQEFSVVEPQDLHTVFQAVQEWLQYRDSRKVDYAEYGQRVAYIQDGFRSRFVPMIKEVMRQRQADARIDEFMEMVDECIQDIERLQSLVDTQSLKLDDVNYIDGLCEVIAAYAAVCDDDDDGEVGFDGDLLEIKRYDGALGQLIKNMLNGIIVGAQDQLDKDRKSDRYRKYFGFM